MQFLDQDAFNAIAVNADQRKSFTHSNQDCQTCCGCQNPSVTPTTTDTTTTTTTSTDITGIIYHECSNQLSNIHVELLNCNSNKFNFKIISGTNSDIYFDLYRNYSLIASAQGPVIANSFATFSTDQTACPLQFIFKDSAGNCSNFINLNISSACIPPNICVSGSVTGG